MFRGVDAKKWKIPGGGVTVNLTGNIGGQLKKKSILHESKSKRFTLQIIEIFLWTISLEIQIFIF